jgi:copper chaperone CopZ
MLTECSLKIQLETEAALKKAGGVKKEEKKPAAGQVRVKKTNKKRERKRRIESTLGDVESTLGKIQSTYENIRSKLRRRKRNHCHNNKALGGLLNSSKWATFCFVLCISLFKLHTECFVHFLVQIAH